MRYFVLLLLASFCLASRVLAAEDVYYVQSVSTKIHAEPSLLAQVLGEAGRGYSLQSAGKQGNWIKVKFGKRDGFVSSFAVGTSPPQEKKAPQVDTDRQAQLSSWSRVRARTPSGKSIVAGVRGLTYEDRARTSKGEQVNFTDLDLMESITIDPVELQAFAPGGLQ